MEASKFFPNGSFAPMIGFFWVKLARFSPPTYKAQVRKFLVTWALKLEKAGAYTEVSVPSWLWSVFGIRRRPFHCQVKSTFHFSYLSLAQPTLNNTRSRLTNILGKSTVSPPGVCTLCWTWNFQQYNRNILLKFVLCFLICWLLQLSFAMYNCWGSNVLICCDFR